MAYQGSVKPHYYILKQLLPNKWDKEHIESKPQRKKNSYCYHLQSVKRKNHSQSRKPKGRGTQEKVTLPEEDDREAATHASSFFRSWFEGEVPS